MQAVDLQDLPQKRRIEVLMDLKNISVRDLADGYPCAATSIYTCIRGGSTGRGLQHYIAMRLGTTREELFDALGHHTEKAPTT